jgi:hypothetical protein
MRTLVLLHDASGHPLFITTHRGDQHLTAGLPTTIEQHEQEVGLGAVQHIVVDREGIGAEFLAGLKKAGRTATSILRTDQYVGLDSFSEIGAFVPLRVSKHGEVLREVAPASFTLSLPEQKGQTLQLRVALIRDLCRRVPVLLTKDQLEYPRRWDADIPWEERRWWEPGWQATPPPAPQTVAKLIPIVSTTETIDAVELAETYTRRWPLQENIIRDFLLPLGLDTNHGYSKRLVENSEVAKKRAALEKRLANGQRWADAGRKRSLNGSLLYTKRCKLTKERARELYRVRELPPHQVRAAGNGGLARAENHQRREGGGRRRN